MIVHALTRKGFGYDAAERHEADQFHSPGPFDVETGEENPKGGIWTDVFADEIVHIGQRRKDVVGDHRRDDAPGRARQVPGPLPRPHVRRRHRRAARRHQRRRAGHGRPAPGGRGLRDLPQPRLRPGADGLRAAQAAASRSCSTGPGSPATTAPATTACGTCRCCRSCPASGSPRPATPPGCASCSTRRSRSTDAPTVVRFPKGPPPEDIEAVGKAGGADVLVRNGTKDVLIVAVGSMATVAVDVADRLVAQGIGVTVVDPRWVKPVDPAIVELAREHQLVVSVEDNGRVGRLRRRTPPDAERRRRGHSVPSARHPAGVPGPRQAGRHPGADRARPPEPGPRHRRGRDGTVRGSVHHSMPTTPSDRRLVRRGLAAAVLLPALVACSAGDSEPKSPAAQPTTRSSGPRPTWSTA